MLKNTKIVQLNKIFTLKLCINLKNNLNRRELKKKLICKSIIYQYKSYLLIKRYDGDLLYGLKKCKIKSKLREIIVAS